MSTQNYHKSHYDILFNDYAKIPVMKEKGIGFYVKLEERSCPDSELIIKEIPEDLLIINLDDNFNTSGIFSSKHNESRRSDFIIIDSSRKAIFIIEMKNGRHRKSDARWQLEGGRAFLQYCRYIYNSFCNKKCNNISTCSWCLGLPFEDYSETYILFKHTKRPKQKPKTRVSVPTNGSAKQNIASNTPDNPVVLEGSEIYWKKILHWDSLPAR